MDGVVVVLRQSFLLSSIYWILLVISHRASAVKVNAFKVIERRGIQLLLRFVTCLCGSCAWSYRPCGGEAGLASGSSYRPETSWNRVSSMAGSSTGIGAGSSFLQLPPGAARWQIPPCLPFRSEPGTFRRLRHGLGCGRLIVGRLPAWRASGLPAVPGPAPAQAGLRGPVDQGLHSGLRLCQGQRPAPGPGTAAERVHPRAVWCNRAVY